MAVWSRDKKGSMIRGRQIWDRDTAQNKDGYPRGGKLERMKKRVFLPGDILLPDGVDYAKWSVIACDQFSAQPDYWDRVTETVGDSPSTLKMIVPEAYLGAITMTEASVERNRVMDGYIADGIFKILENSFVYVERKTSEGLTRRGIVGLIDLDAYEYAKGNKAPIRASENTVITRLPPRIDVRKNASLELPHVMMLIDDPQETVIEPLSKLTGEMEKVYDFELMEKGGSIRGWQVTGGIAEQIMSAMDKLAEREIQIVIGDGNHSLAAAKECWNQIKAGLTAEEQAAHPARYALAELNNVYDDGICFEAIHRVVLGADCEKLLDAFKTELGTADKGCELTYCAKDMSGTVNVSFPSLGGMIGALQEFLDKYTSENGGEIDYIHDESAIRGLASEPDNFGIILPAMDKSELFNTVITEGVFPKKSFSIGHARDKRYYLECRRIK